MKDRNTIVRPLCAWTLTSLLIAAPAYTCVWAQGSRQRAERFKPQPSGLPGGEVNTTGIVVSPNEDHRICPGDVIDVQVIMAPELSNTSRINSDGTFLMPFVGRIRAQQKTTEELAEEIAGKLKGDYLKNPIVKVGIKQIYSHTYFIQGAVRRSGVYQIEGRPTLLELLTVGGGLGDNYGTTAFIIRRIKTKSPDRMPSEPPAADNRQTDAEVKQADPEGNPATSDPTEPPPVSPVLFEMLKANISGLLKGNFEQNLALEPGDIVNIPPTDVFFVAGEVREPGSFPLKDGTTLRQAISLAQGPTPKAAGSRGVIYREDGKGQRQEIKVDVDAVMRGRKDDVTLAANDIVIIPNSAFKSGALPILNAFGTGMAWAMGGRLPSR